MSQLTHKFEKGVLSTNKSAFNSVDTYQIQFSSVSDDTLYDLYSSFIELTVEMDLAGTDIPEKVELNPILQPAGMAKSTSTEFQYLNTSNEMATCSLSEHSTYIPQCRAIVDLMLDSKAQHNQYAGLTEFAYNTEHNTNEKLWDDLVPVKLSNKQVVSGKTTSAHGTYKIRLPYRDIIAGANGPSFINLKSIKIQITWVEPYEFFATDGGTNKFVIGTGQTTVTCSNWWITRCEYINSVYLGNVSEIDPALRGLQNTVIQHNVQKLKQNENEWCTSLTVPFKTSYLIVYVTDKKGDHRKLQKRHIKELTCKLLASPESYKTVSDVSTGELDLYWYYILSHCVAEGREYEPIINYRNWQARYFFTILPLNEMYGQKSDNLWNINFVTHEPAADGDQIHFLWIKEGQEVIN